MANNFREWLTIPVSDDIDPMSIFKMNSISKVHIAHLAADLEAKHFLAIHTLLEWQEVWEIFYQNPWFRKKLFYSAQFAARQSGLGRHNIDDIQQEALIIFSKSLQRDTSLGFDRNRGSFRGFISTVIHRCCQKALRQFHRQHLYSLDCEYLHPTHNENEGVVEQLDLETLIQKIPDPYRHTLQQLLEGSTIKQIAQRQRKSQRTIYRWLERAVQILQSKF